MFNADRSILSGGRQLFINHFERIWMDLPMSGIRTAAQAKAWLEQQGKSVQDFARDHGVDPSTTYQILSGHKKGRRGESQKVAVLLGMKVGVISSSPTYPAVNSPDPVQAE
jgi:gp16 family phage-associated protein